MMRRLFLGLALTALAMSTSANEPEARLKAGWIVAEVEVQADGSVVFKRMLSKPDLGSFDLEGAISALRFSPAAHGHEAARRQTGVFMRYHIVQNGTKRQVAFGDSFLMPLVKSIPSRPWPEGAWEDGLGGEVVMQVNIDGDGKVTDVVVVEGDAPEVLREAAMDVARNTTFEPQLVNDRKTASSAIIDIYYEPEAAKSARVATTALIPFEKSGDGVRLPEYRNHLPAWSDYRKVDEDITEAVFAWDFEGLPVTGSLPASVIHQRVVVPSEGQFLVLPDASEETRKTFLNRN